MLASIDIGTNTIRCIVVNSRNDVLQPLFVDMKIIRLGENFKNSGFITENAINRVINGIKSYLKIIKDYGINKSDIVVTGTSVMRDAPNGKNVAEIIKNETGIDVHIISGEQEADITLSGISSCFEDLDEFYAIDIGGGSTEFMYYRNGRSIWKRSLNMGVVHLTEEYIKSDPVSQGDLLTLEKIIKDNLSVLKNDLNKAGILIEPLRLLGTAGTVSTLAMIDMGIMNYDRLKLHGYKLKKENVRKIYKMFIDLKVQDRMKIKGLEKGREDLVVSGTAICLKSMEFFGVESITVSECGLLEGLIGYKIGL